MISRARNGYTAAQVEAALHSARRRITFRYELLDSANRKKADLTNVLGGSVSYNSEAQIKRTARFSIRDDGTINFLADRIKPYALVEMPDGGHAEFAQGALLLSTPPRARSPAGTITREVQAYDQAQVLLDDKVQDRYRVPAGANYIAEVKKLLDSAGITLQNLAPSLAVLPAPRDWDPNTPKLKIINDLLLSINYRSLWFDGEGWAIASPYVSPAVRSSEYTYRDDDKSVMFPEVEQGLDLFAIPNKWVLVVSEADRAVLTSIYTNTNPNSPTSTVGRGRTIVDYRQVDAVDQATLDALAERIAFQSSQVYETVSLETLIMPFHSDDDVYTLEFSGLGISAKFNEVSWSFDLASGAKMKHAIRRVVSI